MARPDVHSSNSEQSANDNIERSMTSMSLEGPSSVPGSESGSVSNTIAKPGQGSTQPPSTSQQRAEVAESAPAEHADASLAEITGPWVPLTEFHVFPNFPPEIRVAIFKRAAHLGRIVEVQASQGPYPSGVLQWFGPDFATTAVSSKVPSILHTSREARGEALKFYTLRVLGACILSTSPRPRLFYFNNATDILLFGQGCKFNGVIKKALAENVTTRHPIARIAVRMDDLSGPAELLEFLKEMHGYPRGKAGCIGLKEISFVISTKVWGADTAIIDERWDLLPTKNKGLTSNQIVDTNHARDMAWWTGFCGGNLTGHHHLRKWVSFDGEHINFKFCSLRPVGRQDNKVRDSLSVSPANILDLTEHNGYILTQFEDLLGIEIDLPSPAMNQALPAGAIVPLYGHDDKCMEIGITGVDKWQVKKGIKAIKKFLRYVKTLSGSDLEMSEASAEGENWSELN